jgi:hypothetical protein
MARRQDEDTSPALEALHSSSTLFRTFAACNDLFMVSFMEDIYAEKYRPELWGFLITLMCRYWFGRVWIIQEFVAARCLLIICGDTEIQQLTLEDASRFFETPASVTALTKLKIDHPRIQSHPWLEKALHAGTLSKFRRQYDEDPRLIHVVELLGIGSGYNATDPREKVYALLGLAVTNSKLEPRYDQPIETVYIDATRHIVDECGDLAILSMAGDKRDVPHWRNDHSLLSWVPAFNAPKQVQFRPPLAADSFPPMTICWQQNSRLLGASGACIDEISIIQGSYAGSRIDGVHDWLTMLSACPRTYLDGYEQLDALAKTLVEDPKGFRVFTSHYFQFWLVKEAALL